MTSPTAAWYPDPNDPSRIRWWDGEAWTRLVRHAGSAGAPSPPSDGPGSMPSAGGSQDTGPAIADGRPPVQDLIPPEPGAASDPAIWSVPTGLGWNADASGPAAEVTSFVPEATWPSAPTEAPVMPVVPEARRSTRPMEVPPPAPLEVPAPAPSAPVLPNARELPIAPELPSAPEQPSAPERPTRPAVVEPAGPATPGAISMGAALLPPLQAPTPPPGVGEPPPSGGRTGPLRIALLIAVVIATGVLGFGLYTRGTFDQLIGKSGREPSSDTVTVYEGDGYSVELPIQWTRGSALGDVDADFLAPDGNRVQLTSSRDEAVATADLSDPSVRTAVLDTIIRVVQAVYPNAQVLSRTPTEVAGAAGEKLTLGGTQPITGQAFQDTAYLFVRGDRFFAIELISTAGAPDATIASEFEQVVASFRFD